jgi:hypothetical protein
MMRLWTEGPQRQVDLVRMLESSTVGDWSAKQHTAVLKALTALEAALLKAESSPTGSEDS